MFWAHCKKYKETYLLQEKLQEGKGKFKWIHLIFFQWIYHDLNLRISLHPPLSKSAQKMMMYNQAYSFE